MLGNQAISSFVSLLIVYILLYCITYDYVSMYIYSLYKTTIKVDETKLWTTQSYGYDFIKSDTVILKCVVFSLLAVILTIILIYLITMVIIDIINHQLTN